MVNVFVWVPTGDDSGDSYAAMLPGVPRLGELVCLTLEGESKITEFRVDVVRWVSGLDRRVCGHVVVQASRVKHD